MGIGQCTHQQHTKRAGTDAGRRQAKDARSCLGRRLHDDDARLQAGERGRTKPANRQQDDRDGQRRREGRQHQHAQEAAGTHRE